MSSPKSSISNGIGLFITADTSVSASLPIFLDANTTPINNDLPLFITGSTNPSFTKSIPILISGQAGTILNGVNLSLHGPTSGSGSGSTSLFISGKNLLSQGILPLYINGENYKRNASLSLFCKTSPIGNKLGSVNLYLRTGATAGLPMIIYGPTTPVLNKVPLCITGAQPILSHVVLSIPHVVAENLQNLPIYVRGW